MVKLLLNHGADCNKTFTGSETALTVAIKNNYTEISEVLRSFELLQAISKPFFFVTSLNSFLELGVDVHIKTKDGDTLLSSAIANQHFNCANRLITYGSNIENSNLLKVIQPLFKGPLL